MAVSMRYCWVMAMTELRTKYLQALQLVENPEMDSVNPHFLNKYASLNACQKVVKAACDKAGIAYYFDMYVYDSGEEAVCTVITDGTMKMEVAPVKIKDASNMQKEGSALTYAKRYSLCMAFAIVGEEDDDGERASQTPQRRQARSAKPNGNLESAKRHLMTTIDKWAQLMGSDPIAAKNGIKKRPDYEKNQRNAEWFLAVAAEFEGDMNGSVSMA